MKEKFLPNCFTSLKGSITILQFFFETDLYNLIVLSVCVSGQLDSKRNQQQLVVSPNFLLATNKKKSVLYPVREDMNEHDNCIIILRTFFLFLFYGLLLC